MNVAHRQRSPALERFASSGPGGIDAFDRLTIADCGDADVDDCGARLHELRGDEGGAADRGHEDVGLSRDGTQVRRARMTNRDGGVAMQQEQCHRFADDIAPAEHRGARAGDRHVRSLEQLDDARRRARDERRPVLHEIPDVDGMKPVDVLRGIERIEHASLGVGAHRLRQRRLHQDAVVDVASIQPIDDGEQLLERCRGRQALEVCSQSRLARRLHLAAHVDLRRRIVADEDDPQTRRTSRPRRERSDGGRELAPDLVRHCRPVQHSRGHYPAASVSSRLSDAGRPRTTSLSLGPMSVSGSGLNSIFPVCRRWMPTTMTP